MAVCVLPPTEGIYTHNCYDLFTVDIKHSAGNFFIIYSAVFLQLWIRSVDSLTRLFKTSAALIVYERHVGCLCLACVVVTALLEGADES